MHFNERAHFHRHRFLPGIWRPGSAEHIHVSLRVSFEQHTNYGNFKVTCPLKWRQVFLKTLRQLSSVFPRSLPHRQEQAQNKTTGPEFHCNGQDTRWVSNRLSPKVNFRTLTYWYPWFIRWDWQYKIHRQWPWIYPPANTCSLGSGVCLMSSAVCCVHREKAHW